MNKQTFFGVVLLLAMLATVLWLTEPWAAERIDDQPTITDAGVAPAEVLTAATSEKPAGEATTVRKAQPVVVTDDEEDSSYRAALGGLRGRLVWKSSRKPLAGVEVRCMEFWAETIAPSVDDLVGIALSGQPVKPRDPVIFKGKGTSDAEGYFEIAGVHSRAILVLGIGLRTDKAAIRIIDRTPGKGETVDLGEIEIHERGTLTGRVVDSDGQPVAGARVRVLDIPTMALNFGLTRFRADGMVMYGMSQKGGPTNVLDFPRWVAERDRDLPFAEGTTKADGEFSINGARPGQVTVLVTKAGLLPATKLTRVKAEGTRNAGTIKLKPGSVLEGTFVDGNDEPVGGIKVAAGNMLNMAPFGFLEEPIEAGADGKFRITGVDRGNLFVAYSRGDATWEFSGPHQAGDEVRIKLPSLLSATVTVEAIGGRKLPEAQWSVGGADEISVMPGFEQRISLEGKVTKDPERPGTWKLERIPAGRYKVTATAVGFSIGAAPLELKKDEPAPNVVISLLPASQAEFLVVEAAGQQPVAGAKVYWTARRSKLAQANTSLRRVTEIPILLGRTDRGGRLVSDRVPEGATNFFARHPAFAVGGAGDQVAKIGTPVRFALQKGGHVEGLLTKRGMPPGEIKTIIAEPRGISHDAEGWIAPRFTLTDLEGKFRFRNLDPGTWKFEVAPDIGKITSANDMTMLFMTAVAMSSADKTVNVLENQTVQALIELNTSDGKAGAGAVSGIVRLDNRPADGVVVRSWANSRRVATTVDENGRFRLEGFKDGTYTIQFLKGGDNLMMSDGLWRESVKIEKENEVVLDVDLYLGTLELELVDPQGTPLSGVGVQISGKVQSAAGRKGSSSAVSVSDGDGRAKFTDIPRGTYDVNSQNGEDVKYVFPPTKVVVGGSAPRVQRVQAVPAVTLNGTIRLDTTGLTPDEVTFVMKRKPRWATLGDGPSQRWSSLKEVGNTFGFEFGGLSPGTFDVGTWGGTVRWEHEGVVIPIGGLTTDIALSPNKEELDRYRQQREKDNSKGKDKSQNGK